MKESKEVSKPRNKAYSTNCVECGKEFKTWPSIKKKLCSKPCITEHARKNPNQGVFKKGHPQLNTGKTHLTSERIKGEKNVNWKGGITPVNEKIRKSKEYKLWRTAVFERDNWTCIFCMARGGIIHADHIKPFAYYPELRFAIDNGRTLCIDCHRKTETYGRKSKK